MSELNDQRWAVLSERGCEASGLVYEKAAHLMRQLANEKVYGLCVVTDEAARRLANKEAVLVDSLHQPSAARKGS